MEYLTPDDVAAYERDGSVIVKDVFNEAEIAAMIGAVEEGNRVADTTRDRDDGDGRITRLAIWHELGDDIWSAVSTSPRIVNNVRILLAEETAFFHGKVIFKEAGTGGAWQWHQDYGYWYNQGFAFPRMISAFIALDEATKENGCLQVLRGSHQLGRLDHGKIGDQTGTDTDRISAAEKLFERQYCEMSPGSVLFFHCNLLHTSDKNTSAKDRRAFIICYNALGNPQLGNRKTSESRPCPVSADSAILNQLSVA
ncbi:MAG: phytanoyl-CoA dioxygenase family protein [Gemmatimonadetes bacterium]|nr:phytanoyl-CoA dioxygenase family protein [Gemmatimonadota bacterium]|tara:strand:- start:4238 stop:4999 length:762 start_codon:yes stop_codon:yes gene_type:complete